MKNTADCVLFINDAMARFVIAWNRRQVDADGDVVTVDEVNARYSPKQIGLILDAPQHQIKVLVAQAVGVGIIGDDGEVSDVAQKCVNAIIAKKLQDIKGG